MRASAAREEERKDGKETNCSGRERCEAKKVGRADTGVSEVVE